MGGWAKSCKLESCHQGWNRFSLLDSKLLSQSWLNQAYLCFSLWSLKRADDEKRLNATYIVSVARKLGCSVFLLPEDIMEVRATIYYNGFSGYLKQHLLSLLGVNDEMVFGMLWQVNQKMILILTASIMYWSLQKHSSESSSDSSSTQSTNTTCTSSDASSAPYVTGEDEVSSLSGEVSSLAVEDNDTDAVSDINAVSEETPNE